MMKIHKVLAPGLEVEFRVSDDLVREYRECIADEAGERYCCTCGWDNAHIGKVIGVGAKRGILQGLLQRKSHRNLHRIGNHDNDPLQPRNPEFLC